MTINGREMHQKGSTYFNAAWSVSLDDLLQFIGVWMYMLSFPECRAHRAYWQYDGFGPMHDLAKILRLGENGEKSVRWFEAMEQCFVLPEHKGAKATDPFRKTRRFWEALRLAFYRAVTSSWLLCLYESMVKWTGRGMPGLMVILRKPTPIGLELHTLCCAPCGILVWFEVYEGKEAMERAEFCDEYPKSVALSLRMTKKF